ncbi:arginine decarboxylase [Pedobacter sp. N36a]|uniref:arginine decarboxylase n=1 Tax=Pedobacter sp. N36a TaxID=2767996 RepID=UPI00165747F1|nr:arginine decarboxylase [Pedobacter sp. N36a]MBC8984954.1 arginine decarboxylase [Pedobacter sp. N36a]
MNERLLIHQEIDLPDEFDVKEDKLFYSNIDLLKLAKDYGSPLRFTFLPAISNQIERMKMYFQKAIEKTDYQGEYSYYYCTKSSHFEHILKKAVQSNIGIEISSAYDIDLIRSLIKAGNLKPGTAIICNGYKTPEYQAGITAMIQQGYCSVVPIIDSKTELLYYLRESKGLSPIKIGIRLNLSFISGYDRKSRFGLSPEDILSFYQHEISKNEKLELSTLHFFNEKGMDNSDDYWKVLEKIVRFYCQLKRWNPSLTTLDIGGGMPFRSSINSDADLPLLVQRIISTVQNICHEEAVMEPNIITEFGKYTVAEATSTIFKICEKKTADEFNWAIIDGSFITHLPDTWAIHQEYPVLPINNWNKNLKPFILGGLTCDSADYYPNTPENEFIRLPDTEEEQFIAFLHTGAYQEALSGFGGVNHCLIPSPKHLIIDRNQDDVLEYVVFSEKQNSEQLLNILGYG